MIEQSNIVLIVIIVFAAAFTQGVAGFGNALVAVPLLAFFLPIHTIVPLTILCGLIITFFLSWRLWPHIDIKKILPLIIGCTPGVLVGSLLLKNLPQDTLRTFLAFLLLSYSTYSLFIKTNKKIRENKILAFGAGFGTGLISAILSAGGPPTIIYTTLTGWNKNDMKATLSGFFLFTGIAIGTVHYATGLTTAAVINLFTLSTPAVLVGVWSGSLVYDKINTQQYVRILLTGLFIMGLLFLFPSWK